MDLRAFPARARERLSRLRSRPQHLPPHRRASRRLDACPPPGRRSRNRLRVRPPASPRNRMNFKENPMKRTPERLRREREEPRRQLADLQARVDDAQRLANMGDYDWHIESDVSSWSDQLYRIYGHEPQEFDASYDRLLSMVHPADRNAVTATHRQVYESGGEWTMVERIVRPDGDVRHLATNVVVVKDDEGTPVRMRGTCVDITERVRA